jgi:hypothetical protein
MPHRKPEFAEVQLGPLDCRSVPECDLPSTDADARPRRSRRRSRVARDAELRQLTVSSLAGPAFRFLVSFAALFIVLYFHVPVVHRATRSCYAAVRGPIAALLGDAREADPYTR